MATLPVNLTEERGANITREPPDWLVREIRKVGGVEQGKPRFRVIWGGNRWRLGSDGLTLERPYRLDLWHIEKLHEGEYEHCYRLGECPYPRHRRTKNDRWCKECMLNGGERIEAGEALSLIERVIRLMLKTEELQRTTRFAAQQREALSERENKKGEAGDSAMRDAFADAAPITVKRSFETPLRLGAHEALGTGKSIKQLNAGEIARGSKKRSKK